jgi:hypothetical protein
VATLVLLWLVVFDSLPGEDRKIGLYLALLAVIMIAFGGYTAAQGEATSSARPDRY